MNVSLASDELSVNYNKNGNMKMNINDEETLGLINRLLEAMHQAGWNQNGGNFTFVYVAQGAQHVGNIQNQNIIHGKHQEVSTCNEITCLSADEERIRQCISLLMEEHFEDDLLFSQQNHWQAVYRILVDKGYCKDSDFIGFDSFILRVMPKRVNRPYKRDSVRNISKTDFNKSFDRWRYDPTTSGSRIPYDRMVEVTKRFKEILDENGL